MLRIICVKHSQRRIVLDCFSVCLRRLAESAETVQCLRFADQHMFVERENRLSVLEGFHGSFKQPPPLRFQLLSRQAPVRFASMKVQFPISLFVKNSARGESDGSLVVLFA